MFTLKNLAHVLAGRLGYVISRSPGQRPGTCPFADMSRLLRQGSRPTIFDVGANEGQSVKRFRATFPSSVIHSFEPDRDAFARLRENTAAKEGVFAWNSALGAASGRQTFLENSNSDMSSFLELSTNGWGSVQHREVVEMTTIDQFLATHRIDTIDILKSDTQGYEFEVFKGAEQAFRDQRIGMIYSEFIFSDMYRNLPSFDEVFRHLTDRGFRLVSIYAIEHQNNLASWADALFVHEAYGLRSA